MKKIKIVSLFVLILNLIINCNSFKHNQEIQINESKVKVINTEKKSISQTLKEHNHLSIKEQITLYLKLKNENRDGYNFENEDELTMYGYSLLWSNKTTDALEIFKLIVTQFPNSSNPYDSLGEAYLELGNHEQSLINYEKSLQLNPDNFNAEDQIDRIKHPNKIPETLAQKFIKIYTITEYKSDLDQLGRKLIETHPNALKFISKKSFWELIEKKKALITNKTTYGKFIWHCSEIIASINCSHTSIGNFNTQNEMLPISLKFPLQTRWTNNQLFVIDALNNTNNVVVKDEILSINGIDVSKLIDDVYHHIPSQGYSKTAKKHFFNTWTTVLIPYALGFPKEYQISIKGTKNAIILKNTQKTKDPFNDESIASCNDNLCLEFLANNNTAILTISSFNYYPWNNLTVFKDFIDNSFKKMKKKGVKNLIIDLRFNGGGSPESSIYLLKYLVKTPFNYFHSDYQYNSVKSTQVPFKNNFTGKCYFIIDGNGESTTGHFMSIVKDLNLGTIVGEELGSNQFCTAGQTILRLSNTKLVYFVANSTSKTAVTSLKDEIGILPNHYVTQSIDEYLNNVDAVKEFTLKLIRGSLK